MLNTPASTIRFHRLLLTGVLEISNKLSVFVKACFG